jgi:radical SAM superfamily enzyme
MFLSSFQTKQELLVALGLQEEEGSTMEFLRRGYKVSTEHQVGIIC